MIVSSHDSRRLDDISQSLAAVPVVVVAVRTGYPVLFDSGVRRGSDAVKALVLSAWHVLVGRPVPWGRADGGAAGAAAVPRLLTEGLVEATAPAGRPALSVLDCTAVTARPPRRSSRSEPDVA